MGFFKELFGASRQTNSKTLSKVEREIEQTILCRVRELEATHTNLSFAEIRSWGEKELVLKACRNLVQKHENDRSLLAEVVMINTVLQITDRVWPTGS